MLSFTTNLDTPPLPACYAQGRACHTLASHANTAVKAAARALKLHLCGSSADLVSSHSLRAGGAMAMKLNGEDRDTIRKTRALVVRHLSCTFTNKSPRSPPVFPNG